MTVLWRVVFADGAYTLVWASNPDEALHIACSSFNFHSPVVLCIPDDPCPTPQS